MLSAYRFRNCIGSGSSLVGNLASRFSPQSSCLAAVQSRSAVSSTRLTDYKRGRGGRSSFSGKVVTVFGCSGFFGKYVVNRLGRMGCQVICPYRGEPYDVKELKLMGDLGQILFLPFHLEDETSLRKAMQYSNVVVNLIGKDNQTSNFTFADVNIKGAQRIARLAKEVGVERLIHFSALNSTHSPEGHILKNGSEFLRTKYYGELAVRDAFPEATVFRPADMFGQLDHFLVYYSRGYRRLRSFNGVSVVPLWRHGSQTVKQPVFASDVADGVTAAILDPACSGQDYDAVGPHRYRLDHLVKYIHLVLRFNETKLRFPEYSKSPRFELKRRLIEFLRPIDPPLCKDKIEREFVTDTLLGNPTLVDLGVQLTPLEHRIHWEVKPYRLYNYYWDSIGDFAEPDPPPLAQ